MDELLDVKDYLHITWDEENESVKKLISEAKQYLSKKVGTGINFEKDLVAYGLLKDYCRYVRNYSKEYFEKNFLNEIQSLQLKYAIDENEVKKSQLKYAVIEGDSSER